MKRLFGIESKIEKQQREQLTTLEKIKTLTMAYEALIGSASDRELGDIRYKIMILTNKIN